MSSSKIQLVSILELKLGVPEGIEGLLKWSEVFGQTVENKNREDVVLLQLTTS